MKLDPDKFKVENVNKMVDKVVYPECPLKKECFHIAMGTPFAECAYLKIDPSGESAECICEETVKEP